MRPLLTGLGVALLSTLAPADQLELRTLDGQRHWQRPAPPGTTWCLRWQHSVTGGDVADCFVNQDGRMWLQRSYLHDFAAGLGHLPGRGRQVAAPEGGYWIEDIDEPMADNRLRLRVGSEAVNHRLTLAQETLYLSASWAGEAVWLVLHSGSSAGALSDADAEPSP